MQFDALFIDRINLRMANHGRKLIVEYCFFSGTPSEYRLKLWRPIFNVMRFKLNDICPPLSGN